AFIVLQLIMVAAIIVFPNLVTGGLKEGVKIDADAAFEQMLNQAGEDDDKDDEVNMDDMKPASDAPAQDPAKALEAEMKAGKK
ncbi:MAG: C4-dicarboxylate ABC transporter, partial [Limnohabitans sp.]